MEKSLIPKGVFRLRKEQAKGENGPFLPQIKAAARRFSRAQGPAPTYPSFCTFFVDNIVSKAQGTMLSLCF